MTTQDFDQLVAELDAEAGEDVVGLWMIVQSVDRLLGANHGSDNRLETASVCRALVSRGAVIGNFENGEYHIWPAETAIDRLLVGWWDLGRTPDIGEVGYLWKPARA